jgi:hypothetical protein
VETWCSDRSWPRPLDEIHPLYRQHLILNEAGFFLRCLECAFRREMRCRPGIGMGGDSRLKGDTRRKRPVKGSAIGAQCFRANACHERRQGCPFALQIIMESTLRPRSLRAI